MELPIYNATISPDVNSDLEVNFIALVDKPAIEKNFLAFNESKEKIRLTFNDEKQIISGPAMIADMPIYRNDKQLGEYYVVFDKQSIQTIVEKFCAKGFMTNFNLFHDDKEVVQGVTIFNSFISNVELGIAPLKGFEDTADGSWFISAHVSNPEIWARIKSGELKGFSVEGLFSYISISKKKYTLEQAESMIQKILSETDFED